MQIMTILGSPRPAGNTAKVLGWIERRLAAAGHQIDRVNVAELSIAGCRECNACKKGQIDFCSIRDDAIGVFRRMVAADAVLFAAPVFCWGFPAQMKALMDRMYCLMNEACLGEGAAGPSIKGKATGLVLTAGGEIENNIDLVARAFREMVEFAMTRYAGELFYPMCDPAKLDDDARKRAEMFADEFAQRAGGGASDGPCRRS